MVRVLRRAISSGKANSMRRQHLRFESLESRQLLVGDIVLEFDQPAREGQDVALEAKVFSIAGEATWQWIAKRGDEIVAQGNDESFSFRAADDDEYLVSLTITDSLNTTTGSVVVPVANVAPTLTLSGATEVAAGTPYILSLSSYDPGDDIITSWTIDWGDGTEPEVLPGNPSSATHVFATGPNRYSIIATATDEDSTFAANNIRELAVTHFDPTFDEDGQQTSGFYSRNNSRAEQLLVLPDGRYYVAGRKYSGGTEPFVLSRFNADGTSDHSFGDGGLLTPNIPGFVGSPSTYEMAVDSQGRIVLAGVFGVARFNSAGIIDSTFGTDGIALSNFPLNFIAIDSQQRIVVGNGFYVARLLPNGQPDNAFFGGQKKYVRDDVVIMDLTVDSYDRVVVTGYHESPIATVVARFDPSGQFDPSFGTSGLVTVNFGNVWSSGRLIQARGELLVMAGVTNVSGATNLTLASLQANGQLHDSFGVSGSAVFNLGPTDLPTSLNFTSDGRLLVAGEFGWARFDSTGQLEFHRNDHSLDSPLAIASDAHGNVLVAGTRWDQGRTTGVARYLPSGASDASFGNWDFDGISGLVSLNFGGATYDSITKVVAKLPDGGVIVGGYRGEAGRWVAIVTRYTNDGQINTSFGVGGTITITTSSSARVKGLALDASGRLLVLVEGESLTEVGVLRYFPDGTPDNSFGTSTDNWSRLPAMTLAELTISADGSLFVAGNAANSSHGVMVVKLDGSTGELVNSFGQSGIATIDLVALGKGFIEAHVVDAAIDSNGQIVVAGILLNPSLPPEDTQRNMFVARLTSSGVLDTTFGVGASYDRSLGLIENKAGFMAFDFGGMAVTGIAIDSQNRIIGVGQYKVFRITAGGQLDAAFGVQGLADSPIEAVDLTLASNDRPVIAGYGVARLLSSGAPDESFAPGGYLELGRHHVNAVTIDGLGRIVGGGDTMGTDGSLDFYIARLVPASAEIFVNVTATGPELSCTALKNSFSICIVTKVTPGQLVHLALGGKPGDTYIASANVTVDIQAAHIVAEATAGADGTALLNLDLSGDDLTDVLLVQAYETATQQITNVTAIGSPLLSAEPDGSVTQTANVPPALRTEALARWQATGITAAQLAQLRSASIVMVDLPPGMLGQSVGDKIYLDSTAAGHGWFVDATPQDNIEFSLVRSATERAAGDTSLANDRVDMLTVLLHEMGHVLGIDDLHQETGTKLMTAALPSSVRRFPGLPDPLDVSQDGEITALDAVLIINFLNALGPYDDQFALFDVNRDGHVTPLDALLIINSLNARSANGEPAFVSDSGNATFARAASQEVAASEYYLLLALEEAGSAVSKKSR